MTDRELTPEEIARKIVYEIKDIDHVKQICEEYPKHGEYLETIRFDIIKALQAERSKREELDKENTELKKDRHILDSLRNVTCLECDSMKAELQAQAEIIGRMREALKEIMEVSSGRMNSPIAYTSGSFAADNAVYFTIANQAIKELKALRDSEGGKA